MAATDIVEVKAAIASSEQCLVHRPEAASGDGLRIGLEIFIFSPSGEARTATSADDNSNHHMRSVQWGRAASFCVPIMTISSHGFFHWLCVILVYAVFAIPRFCTQLCFLSRFSPLICRQLSCREPATAHCFDLCITVAPKGSCFQVRRTRFLVRDRVLLSFFFPLVVSSI